MFRQTFSIQFNFLNYLLIKMSIFLTFLIILIGNSVCRIVCIDRNLNHNLTEPLIEFSNHSTSQFNGNLIVEMFINQNIQRLSFIKIFQITEKPLINDGSIRNLSDGNQDQNLKLIIIKMIMKTHLKKTYLKMRMIILIVTTAKIFLIFLLTIYCLMIMSKTNMKRTKMLSI